MKIELKDNGYYEKLKDIYLRKEGKLLKICYHGNEDLYFDIFGCYEINENVNTAYFEINEEDEVYPYFENLIRIIKDAEVFTPSEMQMEMIDDPFEFFEVVEECNMNNQKLKENDTYNKLVKDDIIEFYSDSIYDERANRMTIKKIDKKIRLDFYDNPEDPIFGFGIRICNSGSKYDPFNICFMRFFNSLHDYLLEKENNKEKKIGTI